MLLLRDIFKKIDWKFISNGIPSRMHGDYHFENIIFTKKNKKFLLLDWRQDFAGSNVGDVYYDLAKMYGGILMSYKLMKDNKNFSCFIDQNVVSYNYKSEPMLDKFRPIYEKWITKNGYNLDNVKSITALIFLNMAPLHEYPLSNFLFNFGKYNLYLANKLIDQ